MTELVKESLFRTGPAVPESPDAVLVGILRTKRAHGSVGDTNFRLWLHSHLETLTGKKPIIKAQGCIVVVTDPKSDTLFSCHIDTVHTVMESDGSVQDLAYDSAFGHIVLGQGSTSSCLGADDGAGIYVMLRMIMAKVPGTYVFHTGEEHGGVGSRALRSAEAPWLDSFSRAIAFDRAVQRQDSPEVICTQGGQPCASLEFGQALVAELNKHSELFADDWVISHKGSFTDTKVYSDIIPECVNLGVFYAQQHSKHEWLDVAHLESLVTAACAIKWDDIKAVRKPVAVPKPSAKWEYQPKQSEFNYKKSSDYKKQQAAEDLYWESKLNSKAKMPNKAKGNSEFADLEGGNLTDYLMYFEEDPEAAATSVAKLLAKYKAACAELEVLKDFMSM